MAPTRFRTRLLTLPELEDLTREMVRLEADKGGVTIMAAKGVNRCFLMERVPVKAANIVKQEILVRGGELATPWSCADYAADFVDVIVMGNLITLRSLISKLYRQTVYQLPEFADCLQEALLQTVPGYLPVARQAGRQGVVVEETLDDWAGGRIPVGPGGRSKALPALAPLGRVAPEAGVGLVAAVQGAAAAQAAVAAGAVLLYTDEPTPELAALAPVVAAATDAATARRRLAAGAQLIYDPSGQAGSNGVAAAVAEASGHASAFLLLGLPAPAGEGDWLTNMHRALDTALAEVYASSLPADRTLLAVAPPPGSEPWQRDLLLRRLQEFTSYGRAILVDPAQLAPAGNEQAATALAVAAGAHLVLTSDSQATAVTLGWLNCALRRYPGPAERKG